MTRPARRLARLILAGSIALLPVGSAFSATRSDRPMQGGSATQGTDAATPPDQARDMPETDMVAGDRPYCASPAEIAGTLKHDFEETRVDSDPAQGTELWGSALMGTWTLVAARGGDDCIIASGTGYAPGREAVIHDRVAGAEQARSGR